MTAPVIPGPDESGDATGGDPEQGSDNNVVQNPVAPEQSPDNSGESEAIPSVDRCSFEYDYGPVALAADATKPDETWWSSEKKMTIHLEVSNCENIKEVVIDIATEENGEVTPYKFTEVVVDGNFDISFISEQALPMSMLYFKSIRINGTPFRTIN